MSNKEILSKILLNPIWFDMTPRWNRKRSLPAAFIVVATEEALVSELIQTWALRPYTVMKIISFIFVKNATTKATVYYTVLITILHCRDDTMWSERQWLAHGQYEKTSNVNLIQQTLRTIQYLMDTITTLDSVPHQM